VRDISTELDKIRNKPTSTDKAAKLWGYPNINAYGVFQDVQTVEVRGKWFQGIRIHYAVTPSGVWGVSSSVGCSLWGAGSSVSVWGRYQYDTAIEAVRGKLEYLKNWKQLAEDRDGAKYLEQIEQIIAAEFGQDVAAVEQMELALW